MHMHKHTHTLHPTRPSAHLRSGMMFPVRVIMPLMATRLSMSIGSRSRMGRTFSRLKMRTYQGGRVQTVSQRKVRRTDRWTGTGGEGRVRRWVWSVCVRAVCLCRRGNGAGGAAVAQQDPPAACLPGLSGPAHSARLPAQQPACRQTGRQTGSQPRSATRGVKTLC
jgi:hypothetical protein